MLHDLKIADRFDSLSSPRAVGLPDSALQTVFNGTSGDNSFTGGAADDTFNMAQGGDDTIKGKDGNDTFNFGASFTAADRIDGGSDVGAFGDTLNLTGDYSAGVVFQAATLTNVENVFLGASFSYRLTLHDGTIADSEAMLIDGHALGAGETLTIDNSAQVNGFLNVNGHVGVDRFTGSDATASLWTFAGDGAFAASDRVTGGAYGDTLGIFGDYSGGLAFGANTIRNLYSVQTLGAFAYDLTLNDGNVAAGEQLIVYGSTDPSSVLVLNGSNESDGHLNLNGGPGDDALIGGDQFDVLHGDEGADFLSGHAGADTYYYTGVSESTSSHCDTIFKGDFQSADKFNMPGSVGLMNAKVGHGSLSTATFDDDLEHRIDAGRLGSGRAVVYTPDAGTLAGHHFLIIDDNHVAGYQAGLDYVIELDKSANLNIDPTDFT